MTTQEALVRITQTLLMVDYADDTRHSIGDITRYVRRVSSGLFVWQSEDDREATELRVVIELCRRYNVEV